MEITIKKKICIVGSGFCGYAGFKKFSHYKTDLLVVEGGDLETPVNSKDQPFYTFSNNKYAGEIKTKNIISKVNSDIDLSFRDRLFTLGGSSEKWAGYIKPLERSSYLNEYNQNISRSWDGYDLQKYDSESSKLLNSPILDFNPNKVAKDLNINLPKLPEGLEYTVYAWAKETLRLKDFWINKATKEPNKLSAERQILYGFKLIDAVIKNGKISQLKFKSKNKALNVEADTFILAMGGIENARFTEILNKKHRNSNNKSDYIGNFQEHPHIYAYASFNYGEKQIPNILINRVPYFNNGELTGYVKFGIVAWEGKGKPKVSFDLNARPSSRKGISRIIDYLKAKKNGQVFINMRCEQTPNKKSRLNFNENKVDWNVIDSDFKIYSEYLRKYASYLKFIGMAKNFRILQRESVESFAFPKFIRSGAHHMGTVPYLKNGTIIDKNFKHKNYSNLYIVGTSAFPTSGFENPTHGAISTTLAAVEDIKKYQEM